MSRNILLGFEVGTGKPVQIRLHHLAVFGMTQLSGKTTTLEALIDRSGLRAIAFITKRGESGFTSYRLIPPYYKPRADWQYIEGLVNVALGEKVKYEPGMRWAIIKVAKESRDLKDVRRKAVKLKEKARREFVKQTLEKLIAYLDIVIPELERFSFSDRLELEDGVNVMDLHEMPTEIQQLVIASTIEYIFRNLTQTIVIIPEAWEMLPQFKMTPVKWIAQQLIRKGAAVGNFIFLDSQDIGGIDKTPLRQVDNWLIGRMKEAHEVERMLKQLHGAKVKAEDIQTLPLGHFYVATGNRVVKAYVLPAGVPEEVGRKVAMGQLSPEYVRDTYLKPRLEGVESDMVYREKYEEERRKREELEKRVEELEAEVKSLQLKLHAIREERSRELEQYRKDHEIVELFRKILADISLPDEWAKKWMKQLAPEKLEVPGEVRLVTERPTLTIEIRRKPLTLTDKDLSGRAAILYAEGFFDNQERTVSAVQKEMIRRGWQKDPRLSKALDELCQWGYLRKRRTDRWLYKAAMASTEAKAKGLVKVEEKILSEANVC